MYKKTLLFLSRKVSKMDDYYPSINSVSMENVKDNEFVMKFLYIIFMVYTFFLNSIIFIFDFLINLLSGFQISKWENEMALKEVTDINEAISKMHSGDNHYNI